jgi:hypothetical protein
VNNRSPKHVNEGIQATNVHAEVLAVGRGARAIKHSVGYDQALFDSLEQLRVAIEDLRLRPQERKAIDEDMGELEVIAEGQRPEDPDRMGKRLQRLVGNLKTVGVVVSEVVGIAEPIRKIAELVRIPLHMLGL